jgi:hypothetical protein
MDMGDGFQMGLECGHPNVAPGEQCPLCGVRTKEQIEIAANDVGAVEDVLGKLEKEGETQASGNEEMQNE